MASRGPCRLCALFTYLSVIVIAAAVPHYVKRPLSRLIRRRYIL